MKNIVLLDLFAGIGGFAKGLSDAGFNITKHYYSEIDSNAIANYKHNFPHAKFLGSVNDVRAKSIQQPDIITFGSPCQGLSVAGKGLGFNDPRSGLFYESAKIIEKFKPALFIWENVKGLLTRKHQEDFFTALQIFANLGNYRLEWQLVNTSWLLPQNRERIYLVGYNTETSGSFTGIFPITENAQLFRRQDYTKKKWSQATICKTITTGYLRGDDTYIDYREDTDKVKIKSATKEGYEFAVHGDSVNFSIPNSTTRRGRVGKSIAQTLDTQCNQGIVIQAILNPDKQVKRQNGRRIKNEGEPSFTLTAQDRHGIIFSDSTSTKVRRLTEIECERLQGFPDNWTQWGIFKAKKTELQKYPEQITYENGIGYIKKQVAKTQRYKMLGNAVTKDMVENIGRKLLT